MGLDEQNFIVILDYFLPFHSQDNTDQNGGWYLSWVPNLGLSPKYDNTTMLLFRNKEL